MKVAVSTSPSQRSRTYLVNEKNQIIIIDITNIDKSVVVMPCSCIGQTSPVRPNMARMLNTLEPRTLPMAMPLLPFRAETTLVASSGSDVPPATTVRPTMASDTPNEVASWVATFHKQRTAANKAAQTYDNPYRRHGCAHLRYDFQCCFSKFVLHFQILFLYFRPCYGHIHEDKEENKKHGSVYASLSFHRSTSSSE